MAYGFRGHIGLGKETTWGIPVTVTDYIEALSENIALTIERFEVRNIVGRLSEPDDIAGVRRIEGSVVFPGHPVTLGHFLNGAFGSVTVTEILSGFLFRHTFKPATSDVGSNNPLPAYTFEVYRDVEQSNRYIGVQVNRLEMGLAVNQDVRFTAEVIARDTANISKTTPSYPGSPAAPFTFDTTSLTFGGSAADRVESFTISLIDNQLEGIPALVSQTVIDKIRRRGPQLVRFSGTLGFEDLTRYNQFVNQTEAEVKLNLYRPSSFSLLVTIPRGVISAFPVAIGGRERITVDFEGIGRYHTGLATAIQVELVTTRASY